MRDAIILIAAMALSFWVGDSWGLKRAPAYVQMQEREDAEFAARIAEIDAAYLHSPDRACERMMEIAAEHLFDPPPPSGDDRR